jgi:hypothetical protein
MLYRGKQSINKKVRCLCLLTNNRSFTSNIFFRMAAESQRARERRELEERVSYFFSHCSWSALGFSADPDLALLPQHVLGFRPCHYITPKTVLSFTFLFFFYQRLFFPVLKGESEF